MAADVDAVIGVFSARRLLVLGEDSVEIAHDALLQAWKQLRDWLGDDQLDRALYGQVVTDAAAWEGNGRDPAYLYRPGRLATIDAAAARWRGAAARYLPLPATGEAFLGAAHRAARRAARRRRGVIASLLALTVIAICAAGIAVRGAANAARQAANASRQHAIALSRQLADESLAADSTSPLTARRLAVAAWRVFPTGQAGPVLASLLIEQQQDGILPGDPATYWRDPGVQEHSARTASCWPPPTATAMYGCGTRPPGRPSALPSRLIPDRGEARTGWRSARTASSWPPPTPRATCGCGTRPPGRPSALPSRPTLRGRRDR